MELTVTSTRTVVEMTVEQDGWKLNATATLNDSGEIQNLDGWAMKDGYDTVNFNCFRKGTNLTRNIHNVTDTTTDTYTTITELINAVVEKY